MLILQIIVLSCFIGLIIVLFIEKLDYLLFAFAFIIIAGIATAFLLETSPDPSLDPTTIWFYVEAIDWEVIAFLIAMFTIVQILNEKKIFHEVSRRIVITFKKKIRLMFYFICIVSTLTATILEDLSIAIIFGPVIVIACLTLSINPTPFLLGMTICINLAATLTPFGSAQNILIFNALDLSIGFFLKNFSVYFVVATSVTLLLLDQFVLKKYLKVKWSPNCEELATDPSDPNAKESIQIEHKDFHSVFYEGSTEITMNLKKQVDNKTFYLNLGALVLFIVLLVFIPDLYLPAFIALIIFVLINPVQTRKKDKILPSLSHYLKSVDFKLVFFFICLFVLVHLMEANGTIQFLEMFLENIGQSHVFITSLIILFSTSILSAFLDNAPVTIMFIPIINILLGHLAVVENSSPIIFAFILGINLGGNFLPQGSAADLMTLEIAREYCVDDLNYKKLFKIGGLFACLHIILGIAYLSVIVYVF
ncbi:MAG: hypothetical protein JW776_11650 [Candidatus Lokiarchaeota archaeon]|nr:hypothetical protein [Candidatus Lokiarchaeota archaeon]